MITFADIEARAQGRKGGAQALAALLATPLPMNAVADIPEDRWLAEMTRGIFQAGFNWDLIDQRWPQFEAAFEGFSVTRWLFMSDDDLSALLHTSGLVANAEKLRSVASNAKFLSDIANSHGSAGAWFASWSINSFMALCAELKARGSRLGGLTGQRMMRRLGRDSLILTPTVVRAFNAFGVISGEPTAKKDIAAVQAAIDIWHQESGRGLTHISQILAFSVD